MFLRSVLLYNIITFITYTYVYFTLILDSKEIIKEVYIEGKNLCSVIVTR